MSRGPILLSLSGVSLTLGGLPLFEGVDLALAKGERACLIGANGAGKSTLMRIAAGETEPDAGVRALASGTTVARLPQEPDLEGHATLADYVAADGAIAPHEALAALAALDLDPERAPAGLSGGEARRAALARVFAARPDLLLLDEPTNHLDIAAIQALEERLAAFKGATLIVSHDRRFLERVATSCFWLRQRRVLKLDRGFTHFDAWAEEVETEEARALARLETQLKAEEHWLRRGVTARRARNEGRRRKLMAMRAERRARLADAARASAAIEMERGGASGRLVIETEAVTKAWPGADGPAVKDLSLRVMRGDRLGIVGPNGSGKTTLLESLLKRIAPDAGAVRHGTQLEIAYVDQIRSALDPATSVERTLAPLGGDHVMVRGRPRHVAAYARDFLFGPAQLRQPAGALSGGERNRLALAVALAAPANLLVLDEPTNDLDMDTLDMLEDALADYDGTVLAVSHDRAFLDAVATQTLGALGAGRWAESPGGYADFEREHGGFRRPAAAAAARPEPATPAPAPKAARKLSYKDERRAAELDRLIPALEAEIAALEAALAAPDAFARGDFAARAARLEAARAEKDSAETEWLLIEERRAALEASS